MVLLTYFSAISSSITVFWEIKVEKMQRSWPIHPQDHQTIGRDLLHVVPLNL